MEPAFDYMRIIESLGVGLGFAVVFMGFMIPFFKFILNKAMGNESHVQKCAVSLEKIAEAAEKIADRKN